MIQVVRTCYGLGVSLLFSSFCANYGCYEIQNLDLRDILRAYFLLDILDVKVGTSCLRSHLRCLDRISSLRSWAFGPDDLFPCLGKL